MKPNQSPSFLEIADPALADLLIHPTTLRLLEPFLARECTVGQAAERLASKPNTMLRQVQRLVRQGLLEVVREEARKGRPLKIYRSVADGFFVPFEVTSATTLETIMEARDAYFEARLRHNVVRVRREQIGSWGTRIYRDQRGRLQVQTAVTPDRNYTTLDPNGPAILSAWRDRVYLDFEQAKQLQRELFDLLLKYQRQGGAQRYLVRIGMAPILDEPAG